MPVDTTTGELVAHAGAGLDMRFATSPDETFRLWIAGQNYPRLVLDVQAHDILAGDGSVPPTSIGVGGGGGVSNFSDLSDVTLGGLADRDVLIYDAGATDWVNTNVLDLGNIPALPASKTTSGVFNAARLGSGTPSSGVWLRGDGAWTAMTQAAVTNLVSDLAAKAPTASPTFTGTVTIPEPASATSAASKGYVDGIATGLQLKGSARLGTAAALPTNTYLAGVLTSTANGALSVDGTAVVNGDRILVKDEVAQLKNGVYDVTDKGTAGTPYILTRSTSMDEDSEVRAAYVFVTAGSVNIGSGWVVLGAGPFTVGTTAIVWTQFSSAGNLSAGTGLSLVGSVMSLTTPVALNLGGTGATSASAARTALGLVIGTDVQAYDPDLLALGGVTSAADKIPYFTGSGAASVADFTATGRSIVAGASTAAVRSTLGLVIGTDVQAFDADLSALGGVTSAADKIPYFTGVGTATVADFPVAGRTLVAQTTTALQRTALGLGTAAVQNVTAFLQLAGISGGQAAVGGSAKPDRLTLRATTDTDQTGANQKGIGIWGGNNEVMRIRGGLNDTSVNPAGAANADKGFVVIGDDLANGESGAKAPLIVTRGTPPPNTTITQGCGILLVMGDDDKPQGTPGAGLQVHYHANIAQAAATTDSFAARVDFVGNDETNNIPTGALSAQLRQVADCSTHPGFADGVVNAGAYLNTANFVTTLGDSGFGGHDPTLFAHPDICTAEFDGNDRATGALLVDADGYVGLNTGCILRLSTNGIWDMQTGAFITPSLNFSPARFMNTILTTTNDKTLGLSIAPNWVTATAYIVGDCVNRLSNFYVCLVSHTSGAGNAPSTGGSYPAVAYNGTGSGAVWKLATSNAPTLNFIWYGPTNINRATGTPRFQVEAARGSVTTSGFLQMKDTAGFGYVELPVQASLPAAPGASIGRLFTQTINSLPKLYMRTSAGASKQIGAHFASDLGAALSGTVSVTSLWAGTLPTIPASSVTIGDRFHLIAHGTLSSTATSTETVTLQVNLGGTNVISFTTAAFTSNASSRSWRLEADVVVTATGAGGTVSSSMTALFSSAGSAALNAGNSCAKSATASIDFSASKTIDVKATLTATSGISITPTSIVIDKICA